MYFLDSGVQFHSTDVTHIDHKVEGVYETKMPLDFSTVLQLGYVCKEDSKASNRNPRDGWNLSELHMKTTTEYHYMQDQVAFFYLYQSTSEGRGLYALYTPTSSTVSVVVVYPFQNRELSSGQLEKQFRDGLRNNGMSKGDTSFDSIPSIFKVEYVGTTADAGKLLQRILNDYRDHHRGPTLSVIECPSMELLSTTIPVITEFPCVNVPCNARDSPYQALGWQTRAARIGMERYAASSQWVK